ncbi:hypothetical protein [Geosporobacter ferrireducens]|nr:hypothetical protein [Geosporobacter ferrireducens]
MNKLLTIGNTDIMKEIHIIPAIDYKGASLFFDKYERISGKNETIF